jgi:uroporphyrinogen-III synthase
MVLDELAGFVVGVTADRRADEQIGMLERRGASVLHGPAIRTHPVSVGGALADAIEDLIAEPPGMTILNTGIGVRGVIEAAEVLGRAEALVDALAGSRVFARGPKAHGAAVTVGIPVEWSTASGVSSDILDQFGPDAFAGVRVALQLDGAGTHPLAESLTALGAVVVRIPVYRWSLPDDAAPAVRLAQAVADRRVDAVTFTARPQIESLCEIAETEGLLEPMRQGFARDVVVACVGPVCGDAAVAAGFGEPVVPVRPRLGSMVVSVTEALSARSVTFRLGGAAARLQGRAFLVGGEVVQLSERERDLLAALARRPGVVLSKGELLAGVWPDGDADQHAVEVAIARLRRRLGPHGHLLETVFRRGYRLAA